MDESVRDLFGVMLIAVGLSILSVVVSVMSVYFTMTLRCKCHTKERAKHERRTDRKPSRRNTTTQRSLGYHGPDVRVDPGHRSNPDAPTVIYEKNPEETRILPAFGFTSSRKGSESH